MPTTSQNVKTAQRTLYPVPCFHRFVVTQSHLFTAEVMVCCSRGEVLTFSKYCWSVSGSPTELQYMKQWNSRLLVLQRYQPFLVQHSV